MNKLTIAFLSITILFASVLSTASEDQGQQIPYYIVNAADAFQLDVGLMYAICQQESRCRAKAINHDDARKMDKARGVIEKSYGLFQIKIGTAIGLGFKQKEIIHTTKRIKNATIKVTKIIDHTEELLKPEINSYYAAKLLRELYKRYNDTPRVISAYNAGRYVRTNKKYVHSVMSKYMRFKIDRKF